MKRIFPALLALSLAGCGTTADLLGLADPIVRVAETLDDDSTSSKGITTGMASGDARDVLISREYYGAVKAVAGSGKGNTPAAQPMLVDIEAHDGQPITINAKRFKVYAPPAQAAAPAPVVIAEPKQKKSWIKEVSEEGRAWFRDAIVPWKSIDEAGETQRLQIVTSGDIRQSELGVMNNAVTGSQSIAGQAITTFKPAVPIIIPAPAAAATEEPAVTP
jgi:hypothetical protein